MPWTASSLLPSLPQHRPLDPNAPFLALKVCKRRIRVYRSPNAKDQISCQACIPLDNSGFFPWPFYQIWLINWVWPYYWKGFHRASAIGLAWQHRSLTSLDTWSRPIWDLNMLYLLRPIISPSLLRFFHTLHFELQRVLSRFYFHMKTFRTQIIHTHRLS